MESVYSVKMLDKGMIDIPGWTEPDSTRSHHATQNTEQFKTYKMFIEFSFNIFWTMVEHAVKMKKAKL